MDNEVGERLRYLESRTHRTDTQTQKLVVQVRILSAVCALAFTALLWTGAGGWTWQWRCDDAVEVAGWPADRAEFSGFIIGRCSVA